ncbi:hypothetical protein C8Q80DRAFT_1124709 [Daedaleopsis nitida]|nr:hypothetical protein C8Q80DRAFT_1124709 [Daedaleopsis nitida]
MSQGLQATDAFALVKGFPVAAKAITESLDADLDTIRDIYFLPGDVGRWAQILTTRALANFESYSMTVDSELPRRKALLDQLYLSTGENLATQLLQVISGTSYAYDENLELLQQSRSVWDRCFALVFTQEGIEAYERDMELRSAWMRTTFPSQLSEIITRLMNLVGERVDLLQACRSHLDQQQTNWSGSLSATDFHAGLDQYVHVFAKLARQAQEQPSMLTQLKDLMCVVYANCSTLTGTDGQPVSMEDVRASHEMYERLCNEASRLNGRLLDMKDAINNMTTAMLAP